MKFLVIYSVRTVCFNNGEKAFLGYWIFGYLGFIRFC